MITLVNYQSGNIGAVVNMLKRIGASSHIANTPEELASASKIIFPGVGAFDTGMQNLINGNWLDMLNQRVLEDKVPTLGICLGMQLMTNRSEEGSLPGLGWVDAETRRFSALPGNLKVPHMGWNRVNVRKPSKLLPAGSGDEKRFYFAHSYYVSANRPEDMLLTTVYGFEFASAIEKDNVIGVQFHPEKSHRFGMELLNNFVKNY